LHDLSGITDPRAASTARNERCIGVIALTMVNAITDAATMASKTEKARLPLKRRFVFGRIGFTWPKKPDR